MKSKFNFIDVIIILLVLGAAAFGVYRFVLNPAAPQSGGKNVYAEYTVDIPEVEASVLDLIKEGDLVFISDKDKDSATVLGYTHAPARRNVFDSITGEYRMDNVPDKIDLTMQLRSNAYETDQVIRTGATDLAIGAKISMRGKGYMGIGYIIELKTKPV